MGWIEEAASIPAQKEIKKIRARNPGEVRLIRHGAKKGEDLDPEHYADIKALAAQYFDEMAAAPLGSIFTYHTSEILRTQETVRILVEELQALAKSKPDALVNFISDTEKRTTDDTRRWVYIDTHPDTGLGFLNGSDEIKAAFDEYRAVFGGDGIVGEDFVTKLWLAQPDEMKHFAGKARMHLMTVNPKMTAAEADAIIKKLDPRRLGSTPEERAIIELKTIRDTVQALHRAHPGQPVFPTFVGHVPNVDFLAMALLGERINLRNYENIGGIHDYLEQSSMKINDKGEVVFADYRKNGFVTTVPIDTIIKRLEAESAERRDGWAKTLPH